MKLAFQQLHVENAVRIEPPFSPDIFEYNVYPIPGPHTLYFSMVMNIPPAEAVDKTVYRYEAYPHYNLMYNIGSDINNRWIPSTQYNPTEYKYGVKADKTYPRDVVISCRPDSAQVEELKLVLHVQPRALEEGECNHNRTETTEGECWGGGSGSCQVEILVICTECKETISRYIDHRD